MSLHAQRDGSNNISLRFLHKHLASLADTYSADIHICKVSLAKLDSSSVPKEMPSAPSSGQIIPQTTTPQSFGTPVNSEDQPAWTMLNSTPKINCNSVTSENSPPGGALSPSSQILNSLAPAEFTGTPDNTSNAAKNPVAAKTAQNTGPYDLNSELIGLPRVAMAMPKLQSASHPVTSSQAASTQFHDLKHGVITPDLNVPEHQHQPTDLSHGVLRPPPPLILVRPARKNSPLNPAKRMAIEERPVIKDILPSLSPSTEPNVETNGLISGVMEDLMMAGQDTGGPGASLAKKTRGPRQYKCDICGAEFVYAGVYSKHMWKHSKYSKSQHPNANVLVQTLVGQNLQVTLMSKPLQVATLASPVSLPATLAAPRTVSHQPIVTQSIPTLQAVIAPAEDPPASQPVVSGPSEAVDHKPLILVSSHNGTHATNGNHTSLATPLDKDSNKGDRITFDQSEESYGEESLDGINMEEDDGITEVHLEKRDGPVDCWICGRPFTYRTPFMRHMRSTHDIRIIFDNNRVSNKTGKVFTCKICSQSFLYQLPFEKHMKSIHGVDLETIPTKHVPLHNQSTAHPFTGTEAINVPGMSSRSNRLSQEAFNQVLASPHLISTMPSSEGSTPISMAKNLGKDSDYMLIDSSGNRVMFGEKLQCSVCGSFFTEKRKYMEHMQNEHGIQPREENSPFKAVGTKTGKVFTCHICQRRFSYKGPYEKHMRSHGINLVVLEKEVTNESLYCDVCGKVFAYQLPYEKHMRKSHAINVPLIKSERSIFLGQQELYQCDICLATFAMLQSLVKHITKRHMPHINGGAKRQCVSVEGYNDGLPKDLDDSDSDSECVPQRAYLDPYTIVEDGHAVQHQLQCEDHGQENQESEDEHASPTENILEDPKIDKEETKIEPARIQQPGSSLSLIKCELCKKMFRYKIAFSKHMQIAHPENTTAPTIINDEKEHGENNSIQDNSSSPADWNLPTVQRQAWEEDRDLDKPVDYTTPRRSQNGSETHDVRLYPKAPEKLIFSREQNGHQHPKDSSIEQNKNGVLKQSRQIQATVEIPTQG